MDFFKNPFGGFPDCNDHEKTAADEALLEEFEKNAQLAPPPARKSPKNNNSREQQKKSDRRFIRNIIIVIVLVTVIPVFINKIHFIGVEGDYSHAKELLGYGRYEEANEIFRHIRREETYYKDVDAYISMCYAYIDYENGDIAGAYESMSIASFRYLTKEESAEITAFRNLLSEEYDRYLKKAAEEERNGKFYAGRLRNKYDVPMDYKYFTPVTTTTSYVYKPSPSPKPSEEYDPYNAKDYKHPEDFYFDHYYDFFDFYDAENYYYEHCD